MKRLLSLFALLFIAITLQAQVEPTDTDGNGYRNISTLDHLRWVSENSNSWFWNFELDNDINASDTKNWNEGKGWSPIGNNSMYFPGKFDGKGYIIDSLYINRPKESKVGMFGFIYYTEIKNIGITNCNVSGINSVGALVGNSFSSTVKNCYATGRVSGNDFVGGLLGGISKTTTINSYFTGNVSGSKYIGGLVGDNITSTLKNSFSTGSVSGNTFVGGLIGRNKYSTINNSFVTANVNGNDYVGGFVGENIFTTITNCNTHGNITRSNGTNSSFGGFCGFNNNSIIEHCYSISDIDCGGATDKGFVGRDTLSTIYTNNFFDKETSNQKTDAIGSATGKTTVEMKTESTFTDATWNFDFIWNIANDYPYIDIDMTLRPSDTDNDGSLNIKSLIDLRWLSESGFDLDKDWELDNDINANDTKNWNSTKGFSPIGMFIGKFDGNGHIIDSLYINRPNQDNVGLFGHIKFDSCEVKNIGVTNCHIVGQNLVGAIVGNGYFASISNSYSTGIVKGVKEVGGLIGGNASSIISNSYFAGSVSGDKDVGGLLGKHSYSTLRNSYSIANIIRLNGVETSFGGLCGRNNRSTIEHCYSISDIDCGGVSDKAFVGSDTLSIYSNNFFDNEGSNQKTDATGSATGRTTAQMKTESTFTDATWNFDFIWDIVDDYPIIDINMTYRPSDTDNDGSLNMESLMDLRWLSESGFDLEKEWELDHDINASDTKNWNSTNGFIPINKFSSIFNGNNYVIDSLYINRKEELAVGLFGIIYGATIENIGNTNCYISGDTYTGGLVGKNISSSMNNCYSTGIVKGGQEVGGLVGGNRSATISNSHSTCIVTGNDVTGGLIGGSRSSSVINCYFIGEVTGRYCVGGLIGENMYASPIKNSYASGSVTSSGGSVGGLVGWLTSSSVHNSYSTVDVTYSNRKSSSFGGFCGGIYGSILEHCYSIGNVSCGEVTNKGFVGTGNKSNNTYIDNFFDSEFSNQNSDSLDAAKSKTTSHMKTKSTFTDANWDFTNIWNIDTKINMGYPYLEAVPVSVLEKLAKENNVLSLYPNPIFRGNILNINLTRPLIDYTIKIYNIDGILIAKYQNQTNILIADNLVIGSYFILIESGGEIIASEKFIVR